MAKSYPAGKDGAVALTGIGGMDCVSFDVNESQNTESVAAYGAGIYDPYRGSGTPHQQVTIGAFATIGVAASQPGFGATTGMTSTAGATATLTAGIGATMAGPYVMGNLKLSHSRVRAAVPVTATLENSGDVTTTWPIS